MGLRVTACSSSRVVYACVVSEFTAHQAVFHHCQRRTNSLRKLWHQNQVTNFRLKLKISDDDSDDEDDSGSEDNERSPKKIRSTGVGDSQSNVKDESKLKKLVERIPASEMGSRPCALCKLIPGREKSGCKLSKQNRNKAT